MLRLRTLALAAAVAGAAAALAAVPAHAATPAGTIISNTATATYADNSGRAYATQSNEIDVTVQAVASLVVTPKEAAVNPALDAYSSGSPVTRRFTITNTSNITDAYTIQSATTSAGSITSISFVVPPAGPPIPVTVGSTVSPSVAPGATMFVDVTVSTSAIPLGTSWFISLKAQTTTVPTANGLQSDTGQRWALAVQGPRLATIRKLVNGQPSVQANPGSSVAFTVAFTNSGALPAANVVMTDVVPVGLHPDVNSVTINGVPAGAAATLVGQTLTVTIPSVAAGQSITIAFNAVVDVAAAPGTTYVNTAQVRADTIPPVMSSPASVFVGIANEVFDGFGGGAAPIGGAVMTLTQTIGTPLTLTGAGVAPNLANANPFTTAGNGLYAFGFGPGQFGTAAADAHYTLTVVAPTYLNRRISVTLHADPSGTLYSVTLAALDGQQLAAPGGFAHVAGPVTLSNVFNVLGNIPMFTAHPLSVDKSVGRSTASAGDRLVFTVTFSNASLMPLVNGTLVDTLPVGLAYGPGTARVDGVAVEPQINGRTLTWSFPSLPAGASHTIVYGAVVLAQAQVNTTVVNVATLTAYPPAQPTSPISASAEASVGIVGGSFTFNYPITGRVFVDHWGTGRFAPGDSGVAGVRLYIEDGEYAVTDRYGRYSFPSVRPGQHVIHLDTTSLPAGVKPFLDPFDFENPHSTRRLVHGILDTGLLQDINFALEGPR